MKKQDLTGQYERQRQMIGRSVTKVTIGKKVWQWFISYRWPIIGCLWVLTIVLGYIGFSKYYAAIGETYSTWDVLYRTLQLFVFESGWVPGPAGWELQVARFLAPLMTVYTALQTLAIILRKQLQVFRLQFFKNHVVICGLGRKGWLLAWRFRERGEQVVLIEEDSNNKNLGQCQECGAIPITGNAADPRLLDMARVHRAKYLISVCGNDGANAEVAVHARRAVSSRKGKALICLVHISGVQLHNWLREREIEIGELDKFRLEFFNVFESGARIMLDKYPPFRKRDGDYNSRPNILVIGAGWMGESVIVNIVTSWRDYGTPGERVRITLVDREAERIKELLCLRYPQLENACELVPRQMAVESPEFQKAGFLFDQTGRCDVNIAYVCLDNDTSALTTALTLYQRVRAFHVPVVVRMTNDAGLATLLNERRAGQEMVTNIHAFALYDHTCTPELIFQCTYEILARAIHEDYVRDERAKGHTPQTNPSMVPWESLPESLQESNRSQAEHIRVKLEAVGCGVSVTTDWDVQPFSFSPEEIELMARLEHERFVAERLHQGFRYGPVKDLERKTNPTLVPWDELPDEEKEKDRNTAHNISTLLARARFHIYRL